MEQWKMLEKNGIYYNVSNMGNIQVAGSKIGKFIKTLDDIEDFSLNGGHEDNHYLSTHGHYVHRLVAEAWIGPIPKGYEVNHIDTDKWNNKVTNLEIVTPSGNQIHSWISGARDRQKVSQEERARRAEQKETYKLNNQWLVLDLDFNIISRHDAIHEASQSISVSRQAANASYRHARPILKNFYICKPTQVKELKNRIEEDKKSCTKMQ